jgi:ribosome recycling factor
LEEKLQEFISKLEKIRSNRIVLEIVEKEINLKLTGEKKSSKTVANLNISPNHELVISGFEPKKSSLITDAVLELGYDKVGEKSTKEKLYFTLSVMTAEKRDKYIKDAERIYEKGKEVFRQTHQDLKK